MDKHIVLIDFENVQPHSLELFAREDFRVIVFVGANQSKLPFDTVAAVQQLDAEYIQISGNGYNALDFHIAYYIGALAKDQPSARFTIISKDAGFDPLIAHLKAKKIRVSRFCGVRDMPQFKPRDQSLPPDPIQSVLKRLRQMKTSLPKSLHLSASSSSS